MAIREHFACCIASRIFRVPFSTTLSSPPVKPKQLKTMSEPLIAFSSSPPASSDCRSIFVFVILPEPVTLEGSRREQPPYGPDQVHALRRERRLHPSHQ